MICAGLGFTPTSIIFLIQACRARIYGWWTYLFKPLVVVGCLAAILIASPLAALVNFAWTHGASSRC